MAQKTSKAVKNAPSPIEKIPLGLRALTAIGDETTAQVQHHIERLLLPDVEDSDFNELADALRKAKWSDHQSAKLFREYSDAYHADRQIDASLLTRWVLSHQDDADAVFDCVNVNPPEEIEIIRVLSRAGSQKLVFLGTWRLTQEEVVLKRIIAPDEKAEKILSRELQANPLNMVHPNIIETYFIPNSDGERFLVEKRLPLVLNDNWKSHGVHEAANLLYDIAKALKFLHDKGLVHGDVKPDNIGKRGDNYVLLDFGICKTKDSFHAETSATGSLRTRAPELLIGEGTRNAPEKADIWALGATVFNAVMGRFPLILQNEQIPRISKPSQRLQFEKQLANRVNLEWDSMVDVSDIPTPLKEILQSMLKRHPEDRISMEFLIEKSHTELCAFIRAESSKGGAAARFSPLNELAQIQTFLDSLANPSSLIPNSRKQSILSKLRSLQGTPGFGQSEKTTIDVLIERMA